MLVVGHADHELLLDPHQQMFESDPSVGKRADEIGQ
jgi:hypothetical protein